MASVFFCGAGRVFRQVEFSMSKPTQGETLSPTGGHRARKRFGQNFLRDGNIIARIVSSIRPKQGDRLVEIGPGQGAITEQLLEAVGQLDAIELDRDLVPGLRTQFFNYPDFHVHQADALNFDFSELQGDGPALRVVGNLPYNISTPLIFKLLSFGADTIRDMHFMLQKEVVERLAARPGSGDWGRLSVMAQYHCRVESLFIVPPEAFVPRPKVDSMIVRLTPRSEPEFKANDIDALAAVVRQAFSQRRKTLRNTLKGWVDSDTLSALDINPTRRPETVTLEEFVRITNRYSEQQERS